MKNSDKIILDLCGGTGSWAKPYKDAGYTVYTLTLPEYDVTKRSLFPYKVVKALQDREVYGILAAPPCTMFSWARTNAKTPRDLKEGMKCVRACLDIIWTYLEIKQNTGKKTLPLKFWALENPARGFLRSIIGEPAFHFHPYQFGDPYKKETALWGQFNTPVFPMNKDIPNVSLMPKFDYMKSKDIHPE